MNVHSNLIFNDCIFSKNALDTQLGRLKGNTLKVLTVINDSLQKKKIAVPTAIIANLIFYEIARKLNIYVADFLVKRGLFGATDNSINDTAILMTYVGLNIASITLLSLSFYRCVESVPLASYLTISAATVALRYLLPHVRFS